MSAELSVEEKIAKFEEWSCDECGIRKSTATHGADDALCNACLFGEPRTAPSTTSNLGESDE